MTLVIISVWCLSYTTNFGKLSVGHTGRGLRVSSAHAAAADIHGQAAASGRGGPEESTQRGNRRVGLGPKAVVFI